MFVSMPFSAFSKPDNYRENNCRESYSSKSSYEHLIFSFWVNKNCNNYISQKECVDAEFYGRVKFKKELAGKGSSNSDFCNVHQSFCQKFSSSAPDIHRGMIAYIIGFVKKENYYVYNKTYRKTSFRVKRPIRGFRDLAESPVVRKLTDSCLRIPELIASAHSRRFETGDESKIMDDCLEECNKTMVYLEQVRDIFGDKLDRVVCDDLVKRYIYARRKIRNLQKAWQGWTKRSVAPDVEGKRSF